MRLDDKTKCELCFALAVVLLFFLIPTLMSWSHLNGWW